MCCLVNFKTVACWTFMLEIGDKIVMLPIRDINPILLINKRQIMLVNVDGSWFYDWLLRFSDVWWGFEGGG